MYSLVILHLVVNGREANICMLSFPHCPKNHFIVFLEKSAFHIEFLINFALFTEIYELSVVMASLMSKIDIIRVLRESPCTFNKNKL
jgi:hypothetical protein